MNRFLANERTRVGLLVVAAALIGGTGCVTAMVVDNAAQEAQRKNLEQKLERENAAIRAGAERGDLDAMTRLGWHQLIGNRYGIPADPHGITLLEQAAARHYVPAEFLLGWMLVDHRKGVVREPARGLELIKLAATKTCTVNLWKPGNDFYPARYLGYLYHKGAVGIPADAAEAELWMARNASYCHKFDADAFYPPEGLSEAQRQARLRAWWQLAGLKSPGDNKFSSTEQLQETARELARLRQRVRDSEAKYPAPEQNRP